jgi:hypothetical protein
MLGVDAFTMMKIAGHSSITISQRYVHPSPEPCSALRGAGSVQSALAEEKGWA